MPASCTVNGCYNRGKPGSDLSFFGFPLNNPKLLKKWLEAMKRENFTPLTYSKICSAHFLPSDILDRPGTYKRRLKPDAVPSLFPILKKTRTKYTEKRPARRTATQIVDASTTETGNSNELCKEEKKVYEYPSHRPNILRRSEPRSKGSKSTSHKMNCTNEDILQDIKTENSNIEFEYVDVNMEPQDNILDEPTVAIKGIPNEDLEKRKSLEDKYNEVCKENRVLKDLLTQIGTPSNLQRNGEKNIIMDSNHLIDLTDVHSICRVCLRKSYNLISINNKMTFENTDIHKMTVLKALQTIICDLVDVSENLPRQVCTECHDHLKLFITFKYTFNRATSILNIFTNSIFENNNKQSVTASEDHDYSKQNVSSFDDEYCNIKLEERENGIYPEEIDGLHERFEDLPEPVRKRKTSRIKIGRPKKLHTCPICWTKMSMSKLIPHVKSHNTLRKYLNIPKVSPKTRFYAPIRDVEGLLSGEGEKLHQCPICKREFKAMEYILHVHHHLTHDQFRCEKCLRIFKKKSYLLSHMWIHSKNFPFKCEKCHKGFVIKSNYECHLLTHEDGELPHKCVECGKAFSNPKHLSRHLTIHTENRTYSTKYRYKRCKYCGEAFSQKEQLLEHVCHKDGLYKCKYCYKEFLNSRMRQLHTHMVHLKGNKKPGYCPICNLTFKNILYHQASKHPKERAKALCTVCGLYVSNIYNHMMNHRTASQPKTYQCPICLKMFSYRTTLHKHMMIHSGLKPYICSYCAKAFNCRYNLQVHERIHIGDRCHVCPICDKGFLEKSYLNKHMKTHKDVDMITYDVDYENDSN